MPERIDSGFYKLAASLLEKHLKLQKPLKELCISNNVRKKSQMLALLSSVVLYRPLLNEVLSASAMKPTPVNYVIIHDFLWHPSFGEDKECHDSFSKAFSLKPNAIHSAWVKAKIKRGIMNREEFAVIEKPTQPKYARLNTLIDTSDVVSSLETGLKIRFSESPQEGCFHFHPWVQNLLVFPSETAFHYVQPIVDAGKIIIQDLASCLPPIALNPLPGSVVLDGCSAPGNKSTQLCALLAQSRVTSSLYCIEKSQGRFKILNAMLKKAHATEHPTVAVVTENTDFTALKPDEHPWNTVEYILLDPSCSGYAENPTNERLLQLASFQKILLDHALRFPKLKALAYSTCSEHQEENEDVVKHILDKGIWTLENILPKWERRGVEGTLDGLEKYCVKALAEDGTHAFFVSKFIRK